MHEVDVMTLRIRIGVDQWPDLYEELLATSPGQRAQRMRVLAMVGLGLLRGQGATGVPAAVVGVGAAPAAPALPSPEVGRPAGFSKGFFTPPQ